MSFRLEYLESVLRDDLPKLSHPARTQVRKAIESKLTTHPIEFGKPLRFSLKGARRLRVGDYRVIYTIEPPDLVVVVAIGHRRDVYKDAV